MFFKIIRLSGGEWHRSVLLRQNINPFSNIQNETLFSKPPEIVKLGIQG
jgi:hypothetical protein